MVLQVLVRIVASRILPLPPGPPVRREAKKRISSVERLGGHKRALARLPLKDNADETHTACRAGIN